MGSLLKCADVAFDQYDQICEVEVHDQRLGAYHFIPTGVVRVYPSGAVFVPCHVLDKSVFGPTLVVVRCVSYIGVGVYEVSLYVRRSDLSQD